MELDQTHLKEMGIKKIGDRVRIRSQANLFRNKEYRRFSKRNTNRVRMQNLSSPPQSMHFPMPQSSFFSGQPTFVSHMQPPGFPSGPGPLQPPLVSATSPPRFPYPPGPQTHMPPGPSSRQPVPPGAYVFPYPYLPMGPCPYGVCNVCLAFKKYVDMAEESLALLDNPNFTPPSSGSPRPLNSGRSAASTRPDKRMSRQINVADLNHSAFSSSRPGSPFVESDNKSLRPQRYGGMSPNDPLKQAQPSSAGTSSSGRGPITPSDPSSRAGLSRTPGDTPQTARHRGTPSIDASTRPGGNAVLPVDKEVIRVIFDDGRTSVVSIEGCRTAEDIIRKTLKKGGFNEAHVKSYCFWVLDGIDPVPSASRRVGETELLRICEDRSRMERGRLILRKIHTGEPDEDQLRTAAQWTAQQQNSNAVVPTSKASQLKVEKLTGESLAAVSYPLSPTSAKERERHINSTFDHLDRPDSARMSQGTKAQKLKDFYGGRPPSELITSDPASYFPGVQKEQVEKTLRMSIHRSRRISKAQSRLSTFSNFSMASSLKDAPPLPAISDAWLRDSQQGRGNPRPLSVLRLGSQGPGYRDSVASSSLEPLEEESPLEPNRKSYVSFGGDSEALSVTDPDGNTTVSYFDDGGSSIAGSSTGEGSDSFNRRLSHAINEDSDEDDPELTEFLSNDQEAFKYMKGSLIGQGSFGSVYLALHAVTAELMAVKQVEMPSDSGTQLDVKKRNMIEALKHEISLLRDLKHDNIVRYLGSSSDDTHLNIFLEYVPGGSVATMLVNYGPLGEGLIQNFCRQILHGLAYLHSRDIIHRDIKGANILVDNKGRVKISDFGISKRVEASSLLVPANKKGGARVSLQGSVFWMAPEVVKQTAYTRKADIWSLGCLIVEMFTGTHPHPNCTQLQAIFKIGGSGAASPDVPANASLEAKAFLTQTFQIDHESRPTADELIIHEWFNELA